MNHFFHGVANAVAESFSFPAPIVEIGSYQVPGQEEIAQLRSIFTGRPYIGIDIRPGHGVDQVASVEDLPFDDNSVGTVLAMNTFEHVAHFWKGFDEIDRVLRPDGVLIVSCPFYFHIHNHPSDYWRFTPEALLVLLEKYPAKIVGWQGAEKKPAHVWAVAFRQENSVTTDAINQYRQLLGNYARNPMPWTKQLRYQLGRLICGRRPFLPYLEQNKWEIQCHPPLPWDGATIPFQPNQTPTNGRGTPSQTPLAMT